MSRRAILDGARELVEREGMQRLSMPALARHLDCGATSIYWYFRSKDELLAALAEQTLGDVHQHLPPVGDGHWSDELVVYFTAYRDLMERLPAYREVVLYAPAALVRAALTKPQLRRLDSGIGLLHRAGLGLEEAAAVYNVCLNYTRSAVAFEHGILAAAEETGAPESELRSHVNPASDADYPHLSRLADVDRVLRVDEEGFRRGLELLVAGIARTYGIS